MKGLAGLLFIFAIGMIANAIAGRWAFNFSDRGGSWVVLDLLVAAGCVLGARSLWRREELKR